MAYVLVADADVQRIAACLAAIHPHKLSVVVAHSRADADGFLQRLGAPALLVVDLSLPEEDGFGLIESLREADVTRPEIVAWASSRALREFAAHRLAGLNVRIVAGTAAATVLPATIERASKGNARDAVEASTPQETPEEVHQTIAALSAKARQLCGTAGAAVYLRAQGDGASSIRELDLRRTRAAVGCRHAARRELDSRHGRNGDPS